MTEEPFKQNLKAARPFGCLLAAVLAFGIVPIIFLGSVMGDCEPGPGCHDHDGLDFLKGLFWTFAIVSSLGLVGWLSSGLLRMLIRPLAGTIATNLLLAVGILASVWFLFSPVMELLLKLKAGAD